MANRCTLNNLQEDIGYSFKNISLLQEAITHPSMKQRQRGHAHNYERLEYLGDSVLNLVISEHLFTTFTEYSEGALTKKKSYLVSNPTICAVAAPLKLGDIMIMTRGEELSGGRTNENNIGNAMEAIIGAVYRDGGLEKAREVIMRFWENIIDDDGTVDPKSALQEWAQQRGLPLPVYSLVDVVGQARGSNFTMSVSVCGHNSVTGNGKSKKIAEKAAATKMLELIRTNIDDNEVSSNKSILLHNATRQPVSALQEWAQKHKLPLPEYHLVEQKGQPHCRMYTISVSVNGYDSVTGEGRSKQLAKKAAAGKMLETVLVMKLNNP